MARLLPRLLLQRPRLRLQLALLRWPRPRRQLLRAQEEEQRNSRRWRAPRLRRLLRTAPGQLLCSSCDLAAGPLCSRRPRSTRACANARGAFERANACPRAAPLRALRAQFPHRVRRIVGQAMRAVIDLQLQTAGRLSAMESTLGVHAALLRALQKDGLARGGGGSEAAAGAGGGAAAPEETVAGVAYTLPYSFIADVTSRPAVTSISDFKVKFSALAASIKANIKTVLEANGGFGPLSMDGTVKEKAAHAESFEETSKERYKEIKKFLGTALKVKFAIVCVPARVQRSWFECCFVLARRPEADGRVTLGPSIEAIAKGHFPMFNSTALTSPVAVGAAMNPARLCALWAAAAIRACAEAHANFTGASRVSRTVLRERNWSAFRRSTTCDWISEHEGTDGGVDNCEQNGDRRRDRSEADVRQHESQEGNRSCCRRGDV